MDSLNCDIHDPQLIRLCEELEEDQELLAIGDFISQLHRDASSQVGAGVKRTAAVSESEDMPTKKNRPSTSRDAVSTSSEAILDENRRTVRLTPEQAAELYKGHYGRHHFPHLVAHMSNGPVVALVLAGHNAIQRWRTLMGPARVAEAQAYWPDSLRACYGRRTKYGDYFNALHGSENHAEALREIHFFFPTMVVGPLLRKWQVNDYIQKNLMATLVPGVTALAHDRPAEPILWLAEYLRRHNPNEPMVAPQPADQREEGARCHTPVPSEESVNH